MCLVRPKRSKEGRPDFKEVKSGFSNVWNGCHEVFLGAIFLIISRTREARQYVHDLVWFAYPWRPYLARDSF